MASREFNDPLLGKIEGLRKAISLQDIEKAQELVMRFNLNKPNILEDTMDNLNAEDKERKIAIIGPISGVSRNFGARDIIEQEINVTQLSSNYFVFLESLSEVVDVDTPGIRGFELEEIQFSAEITANGEFKLMGTGVGVEAKGGVTFTLKRKSNK